MEKSDYIPVRTCNVNTDIIPIPTLLNLLKLEACFKRILEDYNAIKSRYFLPEDTSLER
jgi:hypothetical protein